MGVMIPILAIFFGGMMMISRTPIGQAIAHRIAGGGGGEGELTGRVEQLEHDLDGVRLQLGETQERLDFAERMLTQVREAQRLPPPPPTVVS